MSKSSSNYSLCNKDILLATLNVTPSRAHIIKQHNTLPTFIKDLQTWLDSRVTPVNRINIGTLLKLAEIDNTQHLLTISNSLSLNDTLWIKPSNSQITWEQVNPYTQPFNRAVSTLALTGNYAGGNLSSPSPEYTLDGTASKSWRRRNGIIELTKTTGEKWSGNSGNRPYSEYYSNQLVQKIVRDPSHYVPYALTIKPSSPGRVIPYVTCPIFTNEHIGYLPISQTPHSHLSIPDLHNTLGPADQERLRELILIDALILNFDRHTNNFGYLINNDTYEILRLAPIFDQDNSLGHYISLFPDGEKLSKHEFYTQALQKPTRTGPGDYIAQGKWALTDHLKQELLNVFPFTFTALGMSGDLDKDRLAYMEYIINTQIKHILTE